ncbi:hypothetical protein [Bradyrhizobium sp. McL0615]|uniref:hypothetical protein n=1 Tax=Bradyrhizobium sp. McL0615 TaxID=3415673 RepID=UPI003CF334D6
MSRIIQILFFFLLGALLWWTFQITKPLPGVEPKGGPESWMPWLSLAGSIVSLLTAIVTLALKLIETRKKA